MADLIEPQDFFISDENGKERKFILSKFPAIQGREIMAKYPMAAIPKLGDYNVSEETMLKLMNFVGIEINGQVQRLSTRLLVDNHCGSWETLGKIELAMLNNNCSFFRNGMAFGFLNDIAQMCLAKILEISTKLSAQSSPKDLPPSTNSEQSTQ